MGTTLKSLIMSFTKSIDLYNYLLKNHHRRVAIIAYHIGVMIKTIHGSDIKAAFQLNPTSCTWLIVSTY